MTDEPRTTLTDGTQVYPEHVNGGLSMSASIAARESYEGGSGGWADGRLGQAYDLIDAVMADQHPEHDSRMMLQALLGSVEAADIEIGTFR